MSTICANCIEDPFLSQIVAKEDNVGLCTICNINELPVITSEKIGQLLEPILQERLTLGEEIRVFSAPDDDKGGWEQAGDPLEFLVSGFLNQDFDCIDEIISAVIEAETIWPPDGEQTFFEEHNNYVPNRIAPNVLLNKWQAVHNEIYKSQRFFSSSAKSFFSFLFKDIEHLEAATSDGIKCVVRDLPEGATIFRARVCASRSTLQNVFNDPLLHAGPPPSKYACAGRMNAEGISVFYGSLDSETAVAELRPPLGGDTIVISLKTTNNLRLLDFERLEGAFSSVSHFDPEYHEKSEKHAFLERLHSLISRPVIPSKETEYLITQTMSEYLSHVHNEAFDGILFSSVQKKGGTNIVIFQNSTGDFPVDYIDDSLNVLYTEEIQYTHTKRYIYEQNGSVHIVDSDESFD